METTDAETILIVDDEDSVRRTFREWLTGHGSTILVAGDAESALKLANQHPVDLAVLDWNLGAGDDGLHLLQDLVVFHPDIVAILVTGYANQATPLDAMRMGVRDYLDKNHDLNRETFLRAVKKQLDRIRPAKQARRLQRSLQEFRASIEKTLPLVQSTKCPSPIRSSFPRRGSPTRPLHGAGDAGEGRRPPRAPLRSRAEAAGVVPGIRRPWRRSRHRSDAVRPLTGRGRHQPGLGECHGTFGKST